MRLHQISTAGETYMAPSCQTIFLSAEQRIMGGSTSIPDINEENLGWGAPMLNSNELDLL